TLRQHDRTDNLPIAPFTPHPLQYFHSEARHIPPGVLLERRPRRILKAEKRTGLHVYSIHPNKIHVNKRFIKRCHNAGYKIYPYTVNDVATYKRFKAWGIDGVFSDNPEIFSAT